MHLSTEAELDDALSTVSPALAADLLAIDGDIMVIGAAGKLGPSLVKLACRGREETETPGSVIAVSRFGDPTQAADLEAAGARIIRADVSDDAQLAALPDCPNIVFLVGSKFGTTGAESQTWLTNTYLPGRVMQRFADSRIVTLSTGNVYPLSAADGKGCTETDPVGPIGEYAMSCLGRERVMTGMAQKNGTKLAIMRLNYAVELRYGVLTDLAALIAAGDPVDLSMGYVNMIWQGFCNEVILRSLLHADTPPFTLNLTGTERLAVRDLSERLAGLLGVGANFIGQETPTALLSDASLCHELFGEPTVGLDDLLEATAGWVAGGGRQLGKPTHFQTRDGQF